MAGRKNAVSPGRVVLKRAIDRALKAAAGLDRIEPGAGEELRQTVAVSVDAAVSRVIRKSESESGFGSGIRTY